MCKSKKQKILYGAGVMGKRAFEYYSKDNPYAVFCFADTFKGGTQYLGKHVISFEEFINIYKDYDVVICIFDFFDLLYDFDKAEIYDYDIWHDFNLISDVQKQDMEVQYFDAIRDLEKNSDLRKKILYGAGDYGELAFKYYGMDRVYAFADMYKSGTNYLGKQVLHPIELAMLQTKYEIILCVSNKNNILKEIINYLHKIGVYDYSLYFPIDDMRIANYRVLSLTLTTMGTFLNPALVTELKDLDFIKFPDLIDKYYKTYISTARVGGGAKIKPKSRRLFSRYQEENLYYGYLNEMLVYADRELKYYEAPAVSHGYDLAETEYGSVWHNLMDAGVLHKRAAYSLEHDCLYFSVGPYFHYARPFYDEEEFVRQKKEWGRNLTVFPIHSTNGVEYGYDATSFVNRVISEAKGFDSITVCTYFSDLRSDINQMLKAHGARIVCAGYNYDPSFVRRLKTIILLSDGIITNGLGSHICHALSINKPVKIMKQDIELKTLYHKRDTYSQYHGSIKQRLEDVLDTSEYQITQAQLDAYEPFVGFTQTKTKEEMAAIFDISLYITQKAKYRRSLFVDSLRQTYRELQHAFTPYEKLQFRLMKEALPEGYEQYISRLEM